MKRASSSTLRWIMARVLVTASGRSERLASTASAIVMGVSGVRNSWESTARKWSLD